MSCQTKRLRNSLRLEDKETEPKNAMHNPCLDSGSGGKLPIEDIIGTNGKFSNMDCILDNITFPECDNCVVVV